VSVQNIQRNPQDTSSFYLAHIYQQLSTQSNGSQPSIPSSLTNPIDPFIPPTLAVWTCGLWFLSLVISLTCALVALSLQQWARRYLEVAYSHPKPQMRARLRTFYKLGVEELRIPLNIEWVPMLLHTSLFLFFVGLSVYLFGVHRTIFKVVTAWIGFCIVLYAYLTVLPILHKNTPCYSPHSPWVFYCLTGILHLFIRMFNRKELPSSDPGEDHEDKHLSHTMDKTAEQYALKLGPNTDNSSLWWTFQTLEEDSDFERFFEGLRRLCDSYTGKTLKLNEEFIEPNKAKLKNALIRLVDRTLSSNLVTGVVKYRRMIIFTKAIESTSLLDRSYILDRILFNHRDWHGLLGCIEFGLSMRNWADNFNKVTVTYFYAQCIAVLTISESLKWKRLGHDRYDWIQLAKDLPVSTPFHPDVAHEGDDDILLGNAIFVVRMSVQTYSGSEENERDRILEVSRRTLGAVCKLDIRYTLPELQHEFCDLWNKLVSAAQTDEFPYRRTIVMKMLKNIRKLYIALHPTGARSTPQGTFNTTEDWEQVLNNSDFYPKCAEEGHRSQASSSFPDLQFNPPPSTQPEARTQSMAPTPTVPLFPEPHTPTHNIFSLLGQPPSPVFPNENHYRNVQQPPAPDESVLPPVRAGTTPHL
jgi:hypothetical protein